MGICNWFTLATFLATFFSSLGTLAFDLVFVLLPDDCDAFLSLVALFGFCSAYTKMPKVAATIATTTGTITAKLFRLDSRSDMMMCLFGCGIWYSGW